MSDRRPTAVAPERMRDDVTGVAVTPCQVHRSRAYRALEQIARIEPILLLAIVPILWFPRTWSGLALAVIAFLWVARRIVRGRLSVRTPYDLPFLGLGLVLPLALLPIVDWGAATPKLYGLILGIALVYALANALTTTTLLIGAVNLVVLLFGGGIVLAGLLGGEWLTSKLLPLDAIYQLLPSIVQGLTHGSVRGGFHPNEIGGALTLLVPLALAAVLSRRQTEDWLSRGAAAMLWPMSLMLILTQSRSAYAGAVVGVLVVVSWWLFDALARRSSWRLSARHFLIVGAVGVASVAIVGSLIASWTVDTRPGLDSLPSRIELWQRSLDMLADFPYTGVGFGQFPLVLSAFYTPMITAPGVYVVHAHNFFLQLGLDLGIPGALAMLWALVRFFQALRPVSGRASDARLRAIAAGLMGGVLGYLVYGLTDAIGLGSRGGIVLWMLLGLGAALAGGGSQDAPTLERDGRGVTVR